MGSFWSYPVHLNVAVSLDELAGGASVISVSGAEDVLPLETVNWARAGVGSTAPSESRAFTQNEWDPSDRFDSVFCVSPEKIVH